MPRASRAAVPQIPSEMSVLLEDMLNLRDDTHQRQDQGCVVCD